MNELIIIQEHKELALAHLNSAGRNLIAFGSELNLIKEQLPHGSFGKWCEENIPMGQNQCQRYMAISRNNSNTSPGRYLDINSEVLLLAFSPEERETIREDLKDSSREEANAEIKRLKLANESTSQRAKASEAKLTEAIKENQGLKEAMSLSDLQHQEQLREAEQYKREIRKELINQKPVYVADNEEAIKAIKDEEAAKTRVHKLRGDTLQHNLDDLKRITQLKIAQGIQDHLRDKEEREIKDTERKQGQEAALVGRIALLQSQWNKLENNSGNQIENENSLIEFKRLSASMGVAASVLVNDIPPTPVQFELWGRYLEEADKMISYFKDHHEKMRVEMNEDVLTHTPTVG